MSELREERAEGREAKLPEAGLRAIAIGHAGGALDALEDLVRQLALNDRVFCVVVQDAELDGAGHLPALMQRHTGIRVAAAADGAPPEPGVIHVCPPGMRLVLDHEQFRLFGPDDSMPWRLVAAEKAGSAIDLLFASLAAEFGPDLAAVLLSGGGVDGVDGLRQVRAAGGLAIVQDPHSARLDDKPRAAIAAGVVDFTARPGEIGRALAAFAAGQEDGIPEMAREPQEQDRLVELVRERRGVDLRQFRRVILARRLQTHLDQAEQRSIGELLADVATDESALDRLLTHLLVPETEFFRDTDSFEAIGEIVNALAGAHQPGEPLRVWVPACATGEEAYSIAILFAEAIGRMGAAAPDLRLFATDIDERLVAVARRGIYPQQAVARLDPPLVERWFSRIDGRVQVVQRLRNLIVFTRHDVARDPPFVQLDLVSCRNLLISLRRSVQSRVLSTFHRALRPGGHLFLGFAETPHAAAPGLFRDVDRSRRLYQRASGTHSPLASTRTWLAPTQVAGRGGAAAGPGEQTLRIQRSLIDRFVPPSVVIDRQFRLHEVVGRIAPYVELRQGTFQADLLHMLPDSTRPVLRALMRRATSSGRGASELVPGPGRGGPSTRLSLAPLTEGEGGPLYLVSFELVAAPGVSANDEADPHLLELDHALTAAREQVRSLAADLEAHEEQRLAAEKRMHAVEEELRGANERLISANEELRSANEELISLGDSLEGRSAQLSAALNDLENVHNLLDFALILVDRGLIVRRANRTAQRLFEFSPGAANSILEVAGQVSLAPWRYQLEQVLLAGTPHAEELAFGGRSWRMQLTPYREPAGAITGAIISFYDITAQAEITAANRYQSAFVAAAQELTPDGMVLTDTGHLVRSWNRRFEALWGLAGQMREGMPLAELVALKSGRVADPDAFRALIDHLDSHQDEEERGQAVPLADGRWMERYSRAVVAEDGTLYGRVWFYRDVTERVAAEASLNTQYALTRALLDTIPSPVFRLDEENRLVSSNAAFLQAFAIDRLALDRGEAAMPEPLLLAIGDLGGPDSPDTATHHVETVLRFADDLDHRVLLTVAPFRDADGRHAGRIGALIDVTRWRRAEAALRDSEAMFRDMAANVPGVIFQWASTATGWRGFRYISPRARELLGLASIRLIKDWEGLPIHADDATRWTASLHKAMVEGSDWAFEGRFVLPGGRVRWWRVIARPETQDGGTRILNGVIIDITETREAEERLQHLARYDMLTDLPNRAYFSELIQAAIRRAKRAGGAAAVLALNLSRFRTVNETMGHRVGDSLLRALGRRLAGALRQTDTLGRLGGDVFGILMTDIDGAREVESLARRLEAVVHEPMTVEGHQFFLKATLGITLYPDDANDAAGLLKNAELALNRVKETTGTGFRFFSHTMNQAAVVRAELEDGLRRAIADGEFVVHYQPQIDLLSGRIVGAEALVRWLDPKRGLISPGEFIPVAEASGLIEPIGAEVLRRSFAQLQEWRQMELPNLRMGVNLSFGQFQDLEIFSRLVTVLRDIDCRNYSIELELTESMLAQDVEKTIATIGRLRALGFLLAVDDFGTGYSSLNYLRQFQLDSLKIDRSFVSDLGSRRDGEAIVKAIIALGRSLGLRTIAEGVETEEQLDFLRVNGCEEIQGFLISRPLPPDGFVAFLSDWKGLPSSH